MRVELSEKFLKELKKLSRQDQERIMKAVERLEDPFSMDIGKVKATRYLQSEIWQVEKFS